MNLVDPEVYDRLLTVLGHVYPNTLRTTTMHEQLDGGLTANAVAVNLAYLEGHGYIETTLRANDGRNITIAAVYGRDT